MECREPWADRALTEKVLVQGRIGKTNRPAVCLPDPVGPVGGGVAAERDLVDFFSADSPLWNGHRQDKDRVFAALQHFLGSPEVNSGVPEEHLLESCRAVEIPRKPLEFDSYLAWVVETLIQHSVNVSSPRCLGHMSGPLSTISRRLAEVVIGLNQNLVKRESSKVLTFIERQTIGMMHHATYLYSEDFYQRHAHEPESSLGVMASGGTLANITAMWCARNASFGPAAGFDGVEHEGWPAALRHHGYEDAVIVSSVLGHYSIDKAAGVLGMGAGRVIKVAVDRQGRISLPALEEAIDACARRRWKVIAIVGLAGATDTGSIDPLGELAHLAEREGVHFHVDACWGAPLILSERYRHRLTGIERADSVAVDGHKQLYLPLGTSMLLLRDPSAARWIRKEASYMLRPGSGDQGRFTLEGSRPGMALFLHAALHLLGRAGFDRLVTAAHQRANEFARMLQASADFELLLEPDTNIVLYRYLPTAMRERARRGTLAPHETRYVNGLNEQLQEAQYTGGTTYVSRTCLSCLPQFRDEPIVCLRAVLSNPLTTSSDLQAVLEDQRGIATSLGIGSGAEARRTRP
jgi:putative pyridoxal-dependent aspartate 1-decarboxylase